MALDQPVGPFATVALDVADLLPGLRWPAQIELRAGRHVVRPRYEVTANDRVRIAHVNVERDNLRADPGIPALPAELGRGYLLPFPILPRARFRTHVQPTPMATDAGQPAAAARRVRYRRDRRGERFLGCLPRDHGLAMDMDGFDVEQGHAELVYDFRDGGEADGWLHALFRYEDRTSGHAAEIEFRRAYLQHRDDLPGRAAILFRPAARPVHAAVPQARRRAAAQLRGADLSGVRPVAAAVRNDAAAHDGGGEMIAEAHGRDRLSGSMMVWPHEVFDAAALAAAGPDGYVLVRDPTCRLFGYHGLMDEAGGFSLDHMFGF